ncbi:MAG: V-type ATP synthase subunit I [Pirellulaceae bacterium]|nr:V-type ATP synthase subunit I [Pirellulaceae bacterium]
MAIVPLQKVTFYGSLPDRDAVVGGLQQMGCLHLVDLSGQVPNKPLEHADRNLVEEAIRHLEASPVQNANQRQQYKDDLNCLKVAQLALEHQKLRDEFSDRRDQLHQQMDTLSPWGEFRWPEVHETAGVRLWFYVIPERELSILQNSALVWQLIRQEQQTAYVVILSVDQPDVPWVSKVLPQRSLSDIQTELVAVDENLETLHWQRAELTRWLVLLRRDLNEADDLLSRLSAVNATLADQRLYVLQAWAPKKQIPALREFAKQNRLAFTTVAPHHDEQPPTLLKNPSAVAGAESAVTFYITPGYRAWDPTWIMFLSFAVFFAMIVSDAAYGMVFGLGLLLLWGRLSATADLRRMRNLFLAIVVATIGYGVLAGSYFGTTPQSLEWLQLKIEGKALAGNKDAMMMLSLGIGVFHLALANVIMAWQQRGANTSWVAIGWALGIVGGYVLGLFAQDSNKAVVWLAEGLGQARETFQPQLKLAGQWGLGIGLGLIFLFSSNRPLLSAKPADWAWRVLDGLLGLTNVSKAFGDALSYLRLFALGLAGAQLAVTFNNMAESMQQIPGVGMLLAILLLVLGHGVNMVLGIMGGVVHGLRLNCIEFFNWSLTEEGHPFRAFRKKAA